MRICGFSMMALAWVLALLPAACSGGGSEGRTDGDIEADGDPETPDGDAEDGDGEGGDEGEALDRWGFPEDHPLLADRFLNVAHRGGGRLAPEESMEAFRNAVAVGADMLEMDLHATLDGVIVLHHDATVDRITDGEGKISGMTFEELCALDAGYAFTPDDGQTHPYRGRGVRVATFREVLEAFPAMIFSAEIKQRDPSIVDAVLEILADTGMEDRVILVSFFDDVVAEVRQKNPRIVTGAATGEMAEFGTLTEEEAAAYDPPCPVFQLPGIGADLLDLAHRLGVKVQIWTVNDADDLRAWIDLGVDGVMTDDPALLASVLQETAAR